jgi:hypothetical protein
VTLHLRRILSMFPKMLQKNSGSWTLARDLEPLSDSEERRLGQYIEAFRKIRRHGYGRANIREFVHLAARSSGKHRLWDSLCKVIDGDDVLLSQLRNQHSSNIFHDDLKILYMAELDALQDLPLFGPFSPEAMDYSRKTLCLHLCT